MDSSPWVYTLYNELPTKTRKTENVNAFRKDFLIYICK